MFLMVNLNNLSLKATVPFYCNSIDKTDLKNLPNMQVWNDTD